MFPRADSAEFCISRSVKPWKNLFYIFHNVVAYGGKNMSDLGEEDYTELTGDMSSLGEPSRLWYYFRKTSEIPHGSKDEERIREYMKNVAGSLGLDHEVDGAGNLLVRKPATPGKEDTPILILQGHMDMVCEKNEEVVHDFSKDALRLRVKGDYLYATETTLGADNGVGAAAMLAIMEDTSLGHGPLEFLFTVDEETGLTGAFQLEEGFLKGRRMLNLDTEEEGAIYVGCAGGADCTVTLPVEFEDVIEGAGIKINVTGLLGGHSGVDAHLGRGNSNVLLARLLKDLSRNVVFQLVDIGGGTKRNAIPRQSWAKLFVDTDAIPVVEETIIKSVNGFKAEFTVEPDLTVERTLMEEPVERCLDVKSTRTIIDLLLSLPNGVQAMSQDIPDLVETSSNLAIIGIKDNDFQVWMNSRSSVESALEWALDHIESISSLAGAGLQKGGHYPGWKPDLNSKLLARLKVIHEEVLGSVPEIKAIHAGLETGIIGKKFPGMDMVSIGPQIEHPHSPMERVKISSVYDFWRLLTTLLEKN